MPSNKSVAILGGAFDPITKGHVSLAEFVLDNTKVFDEVWVMPCYQHMYNKKMAPSELRLSMCLEACKHNPRIIVSDFEIVNKVTGGTYNLFNSLQKTYSENNGPDFSMIIGQDNADSFHRWVNYQYLENTVRFVVVPRKGFNPVDGVGWYFKPPHIYLSGETIVPEISSTDIRKGLEVFWEKGTVTETVGKYLSHEVFKIITNFSLYK
jgi:nicotinate-nucleotide adenylyltransferase